MSDGARSIVWLVLGFLVAIGLIVLAFNAWFHHVLRVLIERHWLWRHASEKQQGWVEIVTSVTMALIGLGLLLLLFVIAFNVR